MKKLLSALFLLALCSSLAMATVPDPTKCTVTPDLNGGCLIAPGTLSGTVLSINVRNSSNNPIPDAVVQVVFNAAIEICTTATHNASTDANGNCTVALRGGGCVNASTAGACVVIANGIEIKNYNKVKSPDNASHDSSVPSGTVTIADLPFFGDEFKGTAAAACHDYTNDGFVTTADLPFFGDAFKAGLNCPL
jgi:hypothetical protein